MNRTTQKLLKWEVRWIPVEILMTGLGLFLLLGLQLAEAGAGVLFLALALSVVVRFTHYCATGRQQATGRT